MVNLYFTDQYRAVHVTNECGAYMMGGIATFMNEMYTEHDADTGFIHLYDSTSIPDLELSRYPGTRDILAVPFSEAERLSFHAYEVVFLHFYGLSFLLDGILAEDKPLVYVVHSVPTTEPYDPNRPFGMNDDVKFHFERCCSRAKAIVCISEAEKRKLIELYPEFTDKITVIMNGMSLEKRTVLSISSKRTTFGFIGRLDYRKGLLELIKTMRHIDGELLVACGNEDPEHLAEILLFIEGAQLEQKVKFIGWCQGERKQAFFEAIDALIVPSLYEPFGYVILEAMNRVVPLICSDRGGIPEIVGEDYPYLFQPYEAGSLKAAIERYQHCDQETLQAQVEQVAERSVIFSGEAMRGHYRQLLDEMI